MPPKSIIIIFIKSERFIPFNFILKSYPTIRNITPRITIKRPIDRKIYRKTFFLGCISFNLLISLSLKTLIILLYTLFYIIILHLIFFFNKIYKCSYIKEKSNWLSKDLYLRINSVKKPLIILRILFCEFLNRSFNHF